MKWNDYIIEDEEVLLGKPSIKGTRISVEHIINLLAEGWSDEQILENYPRLSRAALQAVFYSSLFKGRSFIYNKYLNNLYF